MAIRDEMHLLRDKKKALTQTYEDLLLQIQHKKDSKNSSFKGLFKKGMQ